MTAEEIRKVSIYGGDAGTSEIAEMLREIAAQLAELNHTLDRLTNGKKELSVFATVGHP